jgi:hypothetical protein
VLFAAHADGALGSILRRHHHGELLATSEVFRTAPDLLIIEVERMRVPRDSADMRRASGFRRRVQTGIKSSHSSFQSSTLRHGETRPLSRDEPLDHASEFTLRINQVRNSIERLGETL